MDNENAGTLTATVNWLEVEQRDAKDRLHRFQQSIEQMHTILQDHAYRLQTTEANSDALKLQSSKLPAIEEDVRQLKEKIGQMQESHSDILRSLDRLERSKKAEDDTTRDAIRGLTRSIEELTANAESLTERHRSLEAVLRRQQEQLDWLKGQQEEMRRGLDPLTQAVSAAQEHYRKIQERVEQVGLGLEPLRQQDEVMKSKQEIAEYEAKQIQQRLDTIDGELQARHDVPDRLDAQKINLDRVDRQSIQALQLIEKLSDALEKQAQHVRDVESRGKGLLDQMLRLQQRNMDVHSRLDELLAGIGEMLEQDKRRQMSDLEGQFRGLKERLARMRGAALTASEDLA